MITKSYKQWALVMVVFFAVLPKLTLAQFENVWVFGLHAGLDFTTGVPLPIQSDISGFGEANASICDHNGQLLFYTEGSRVWDRNGNLMTNGNNLTPISASNVVTSSSSQGALITHMPDSSGRYYIFSLTAEENGANKGRLYYSVVDMDLNNGLGAVVSGYKGILIDTLLTEKMTAVAGNDCNIWLLCQSQSDELKAYELSGLGINPVPTITRLGSGSIDVVGNIALSPDRRKLVVTNFNSGTGALLFDFDPATGRVDNKVVLDITTGYYGACFSPDNQKLYVNSYDGFTGYIYQYDFSSGSPVPIQASRTFIAEVSTGIFHLKAGPDQKIYFCSESSLAGAFIGAINFPNLSGPACQFVDHAITLPPGMNIGIGLPNVVPLIRGGSDTVYAVHSQTAPCFASGSVLAVDSNVVNVLWENGSTGNQRIVTQSGRYWVSYTQPEDLCVLYVDTFEVRIRNTTFPELHSVSSCRNASNGFAWLAFAPEDTASYTFAWRNSQGGLLSVSDSLREVSPGHYTLEITLDNGCDTFIPFVISEDSSRLAFAVDTLVCSGELLNFQNTSDTSFTGFQWDYGDGTGSSMFQEDHRFDRSGHYRIRLIGTGAKCTDTTTQVVIVDPKVSVPFEAEPKRLCLGRPIVFRAKPDTTIQNLFWNFGDGYSREEDALHQTEHAYEHPGKMEVVLTAHFRACPDTTATQTIDVFPFPEVDLGDDNGICLHGQPVYLKNLREAPLSTYHRVWSTGDTTAVLKVVHPGIYTLSVTTDPVGCTTTETITITKDCYIDIPNAFTPDGDGHNDYFFPRQLLSESLTRFRMQVYNRWGQLVFETTNLNGRGWEGNFNGKAQPMGVYLYRIEADFSNGRQEQYEGNVTLLR